MSTPRKHWFKVADSVAHEPWSNDVAATFMRLAAHLNTRWAREGRTADQAVEVVLSRGTSMQLTGSGSLARARSILRELAAHISLVIDEQGTNTLVRWPKFAEFQRFESRNGALNKSDVPPEVPHPQDARRKTQDARRKGRMKPPKPPAGQAAVAAFCEAFETARRAKYAPEPKDCAWLKQRAEEIGLEAFKAMLSHFFALEDSWVASQGWNVDALRRRWQACHAKAQEHERYLAQKARLELVPDIDPSLPKEFRF